MDVCRADDFCVLYLFQAVGTPAGHTRRSKEGRVKVSRDAEHLVNEPRVKVDVCGKGVGRAVSFL